MINKLKEVNEALPLMYLIDLIFLIIGEIVIVLFVPDKGRCAVGLLAGVLYSVYASFHMSLGIRKVVYGRANATKTYLVGYFLRIAVMAALFCLLYFLDIGNLVCLIIGMFAMKVSAYLQPFTHKLISKILGKGR